MFLLDTVEKHDHPWELRLSSLSADEAILTRSKVSRIYFVENRVREFVKVIAEGRGRPENSTIFALRLQEKISGILSIISTRFQHFNPQLIVACRWMEEKKEYNIGQALLLLN